MSEDAPVTARAIAERAGLPQPTVIRILETLIAAGYLYREATTARYGITARTLALSRGYNATSRLVQIAQPLIEALRAEIGWPSNLATYEQDCMVIAYTNRAAKGLSMPGRLGARLPLMATGVGMIYLASMSSEDLEAVLARLRLSEERWDRQPHLWADLDHRLSAARRRGYAFADEEYLDAIYQSRIWAVAVPILVQGRAEAALSSLVLRASGSRRRIVAQILPSLRRTAATIANELAADAGIHGGDGAADKRTAASPRLSLS